METKPMSIVIHDAKEDIIQTINKHNLPASVLLLLMKDILTEVTALDARVYNEDLQNYNTDTPEVQEEEPEKVPEEEVTVEE